MPTFDLVEVGTGGGSIAWVDRGALRVGPRSAGAEPGPVCYRRGGTEPTVTDANVVLGRINPLAIAGGSVELDVTAAREAIARLGERIDLDDTLRVAHGITEVGNVVMMRALRAVSTERGYDPRDFAMVAFGGSGPLHAAALAEQLSISTVVIPPFPGLFSAVGLLLADYRLDYVASVLQDADEVTDDVLCARFAQLEQDAVADFEEMGMGGAKLEFARSVDVRYVYQMEEMPIALPENLREGIGAWVSAEFVASHEREYGYVGSGPKSIVNIRVRATAPADTVSFGDFARGNYDSPSSEPSIRLVYFGPQSGTVTTTIAGRGDFDEPRLGPFVVEEPDATIVIPPGWRVVRHPNSSLILTRESGSPNTGKAH